MMEYKRKNLIDLLESSGKESVASLALFSTEEVNNSPGSNEWSPRDIAIHLRDTEEQVFLLRTERALKGDRSVVPGFVQEEWARDHSTEDESLEKIVSDFRSARRKLIRLLRQASFRDWEAWVTHSKLGKLSIGVMAEFNYSHTLNHLAQLIDVHEKLVLNRLNDKSPGS